mgnify:CR=1 FL=1
MKFVIKYIGNNRIECDIDGVMYYANNVDDAILKRVVKMKGGRGLNYLKKCCVLRRAQPTVPADKPLN